MIMEDNLFPIENRDDLVSALDEHIKNVERTMTDKAIPLDIDTHTAEDSWNSSNRFWLNELNNIMERITWLKDD